MAFLDNSGDIILDAVLTDTGRFRLAKGDGSFKIAKFAFGDDEINYGNYDKRDIRGSAYYDLDILQTPVLEAFTNNTSNMNSKLITIPRTNLLFLPIMRLNTKLDGNATVVGTNSYYISVDQDTSTQVLAAAGNSSNLKGYIDGHSPDGSSAIRIDQGLHTSQVPITFTLDPDLVETSYIVQMDHRLGSLATATGFTAKNPRFIDDDNIAHYYISSGVDSDIVTMNGASNPDSTDEANQVIHGPRGSIVEFVISPSIELASSAFLFSELGGTFTWTPGSSVALKHIDTIIRVQGATTGYAIDVPVRFIKY